MIRVGPPANDNRRPGARRIGALVAATLVVLVALGAIYFFV